MPKFEAARREVGAEEFIREWQKAESFAAFCEKTGVWPSSARTRSSLLRRKGIPLKKFTGGRKRLDWNALKALAMSLDPSQRNNARRAA